MGRRSRNDSVLLTAAALGAISGVRSMAAPALMSQELVDSRRVDEFGPLEQILASPITPKVMALLAGGEMLADKTDLLPNRTAITPLVGRAVLGSVAAAAFAVHRRHPVLLAAAIGAASAVASTFAAFHLRHLAREEYNVPDALLGLVEDGIVVTASKLVMDTID